MDVLFLSISMGGGHLKAAEAVKERVELRFPGSRTLILDTLNYINPIIDRLIVGGYLNAVKKTPQIYGKFYQLTESSDNANDFSKTLNKLLSFRVRSLVNKFKPSIIVCTHPFPLQMLLNLRKKNKVNVPVVGILTDFTVHSFWLHKNVDAYIVAHEHMKHEMVRKGIPEQSVYPFGIPVSGCFLKKKDRVALLHELKLEDMPTALIMGGSLGIGEIRNTFLAMLNCKKDLQIIAVTGKNLKLKLELEKLSMASCRKVKIISYTNRIADYMDISDFIVTKPGGMTITEALVKELPILIISPIPGQEERNAHFLISNGAAIMIPDSGIIDSVICQLVDNPSRLKHMKEMAGYLARPDSSDDAVSLLERLVSNQRGDFTNICQ